jgi:hypothetical protein
MLWDQHDVSHFHISKVEGGLFLEAYQALVPVKDSGSSHIYYGPFPLKSIMSLL